MDPQIQYAKTEDGVNIAYYVMGEGEPLMYTPHSLGGHIQLEWEWPEWRSWYEAIALPRRLADRAFPTSIMPGNSDGNVSKWKGCSLAHASPLMAMRSASVGRARHHC